MSYQTIYQQNQGWSESRTIVVLLVCVLLLTVSAKLFIPAHPVSPILQAPLVINQDLLAGLLISGISVLKFLLTGAAGLPGFAGSAGQGTGLLSLTGPSGYLTELLPAAILVCWLAKMEWCKGFIPAFAIAMLATAAIYLPGVLWPGDVVGGDKPVLQWGLYPFVLGDLAMAAIAALAFPAIRSFLDSKELD